MARQVLFPEKLPPLGVRYASRIHYKSVEYRSAAVAAGGSDGAS